MSRSAFGRWGALAVIATGLLVGAPSAHADEQPSILKAYGLDWIERVREEAWPQPKLQRPVICLLDTGVAVTPDTPDTDLNGPIVARLAIDGSDDGLPQGTAFEHLHGTQMAAVIAAPRNGYGTVGVFPQARIVSVRVTEGSATFITPGDVVQGVRECGRWAGTRGIRIAAFVMAESRYDQRVSDVDIWKTAATNAASYGGVMIAAAGNDENAQLVAPLAVLNALVVGAGNDLGGRCAFAAPAQELAVLGPGCSDERRDGQWAWPAGSSAATAAVGGLAGALATRQPTVDASTLLVALRSATIQTPTGGVRFDAGPVAATFTGLVAPPVQPVVPPNTATVVTSDSGDTTGVAEVRLRLWRPTVSARWARHRLVLRRSGAHLAGDLRVLLPGKKSSAFRFSGRRHTMRLAARPARVTVWAEASRGTAWRSLSRHVKVG